MTEKKPTDIQRPGRSFNLAATIRAAKAASLLVKHGYDAKIVTAAVMHNTAKDRSDFQTIRKNFGAHVMSLIAEATDPEELENSAHHSAGGRPLVIAVKTAMLDDLLTASSKDLPRGKIIKQFRRAKKIVDNCRAMDPELEKEFDSLYKAGQKKLRFE